ncbi:MAG: histidine kinase, partial [Dehalococcoidia bacterium]
MAEVDSAAAPTPWMARFRNTVAWKVTLWFLLLSMVPIAVVAIFVRQDVETKFNDLTRESTEARLLLLVERITMSASPDGVQAVLTQTSVDGQTAFLVGDDGRYRAHADPDKVGGSAADDLAGLIAAQLSGDPSGVFVDQGTGRVVGFAQLPTGDTAVLSIAEDVVSGPVRDVERSAALQLGLSLLVVSLAGGAVIWLFFQPINRLKQAAVRIGEGDLDVRVDASNMEGELEVLGNAFNEMANEVRTSVTDLERRVSERTELLSASEQRYRALFEQSHDAIFVAVEGKIVDLNPAALTLFGFTWEQGIGSDVGDRWVDQTARTQLREAIVAGGGEASNFEAQLTKADGTVMDCLLSVRQRGESPETGIEGTVRDITEWKRTEEELFEQTRSLAVLDERNRMAREIHDTLAQGFTGVVLQLEAAEQALGEDADAVTDHIGKAKELARGSLQEARRTVWDLLPSALEHRNIKEVLNDEVERFAVRGHEQATFSSDGSFQDVPQDVQATLLRICQEALMNTRKYARAEHVWVSLVRETASIK